MFIIHKPIKNEMSIPTTTVKFTDTELNDYFEMHFNNPENPMPDSGNEDEIDQFMSKMIRSIIRKPNITNQTTNEK